MTEYSLMMLFHYSMRISNSGITVDSVDALITSGEIQMRVQL